MRCIVTLMLMRRSPECSGPSGTGIVDWSRWSSLVSLIWRKITYSSHTSQPMVSTAQIETRPPSFVASLTSRGTLRKKCASRTRTIRGFRRAARAGVRKARGPSLQV